MESAFTRGGMQYNWLYETYGIADPGPDPRRIVILTQAYLFFVVGSVLFPTTGRNVVHPRYIRHLHRLRHVPTWSWNSAVLSYLYRVWSMLHRRARRRLFVVYDYLCYGLMSSL